MTPAEEIKSIRASLGLTWVAFAARVGVTWRTVAYWEAGKRKPSRSAMMLIHKLRRSKSCQPHPIAPTEPPDHAETSHPRSSGDSPGSSPRSD